MLFDLKGRRRHVVQATYLMLAVLMGGGLILFGIGGGTNGGLLDAFKGGGGNGGNSVLAKEITAAQARLAANPQDQAALTTMVKDNYQLAAATVDTTTGAFDAKGKAKLAQADTAWTRYLALSPTKPNDALASYMIQAYSPLGLNRPAKAQQAAEIVSAARPSSTAYIQVVYYASLANDSRTAKLAADKALALAPKSQRSSVQSLIKQAEDAGLVTTTPSTSGG